MNPEFQILKIFQRLAKFVRILLDLTANDSDFIQTINSRFPTNIPLISDRDLQRIFLKDPFQDKDGDARVRGRYGAGLLETLGPVLGISGGRNDFIPDALPTQISPRMGEQFIHRYLTLRGIDPQMASEWSKWDAIEVFRYIFRLNILDGSEKWGNKP